MEALLGLEYFRFYVYGKRVNLLTDHKALQPLLKKNRAHKQYSARLTRWLDRLSHFDVNLQYTAGKKHSANGLFEPPSDRTDRNYPARKQSGRIKRSGRRKGVRR